MEEDEINKINVFHAGGTKKEQVRLEKELLKEQVNELLDIKYPDNEENEEQVVQPKKKKYYKFYQMKIILNWLESLLLIYLHIQCLIMKNEKNFQKT